MVLKHTHFSTLDKNWRLPFYREILAKLGIGGRVSVMMARKKWNYLIKKYQVREKILKEIAFCEAFVGPLSFRL